MSSGFLFYGVYPGLITSSDIPTFSIFVLLNLFVNYFLFLIFNTALEMIIVRRLRREIEEKKLHRAELTHMSPESREFKRRQESDSRMETRAIVMVITNSVINMILRFPDFFSFIINSNDILPNNIIYQYFCGFLGICPGLVEIADFFFILTFTSNCLIYYFFNSKFKKFFRVWPTPKK